MTNQKDGNNARSIKDSNRALALRLIAANDGISRVMLSNLTGLTKMTLTNITSELLEQGFIQESVPAYINGITGGAGRRPMLLRIAPESPCVMGILISRDSINGVVCTLEASIITTCQIVLAPKETAQGLTKKLRALFAKLSSSTTRTILGIGVASVGPLDIKSATILSPHSFHGIENFSLRGALKKVTDLPVFLDNDMNGSALAERLFGGARDIANFIYIGITNGVGAGIISGGTLFSGSLGFGGEIGHMTIDYNGLTCPCGNRGCLETYVSTPVVLQRINAAKGSRFASFKQAILALPCDPIVCEVLDDMCDKLSIGLVSICNVLDPQVVFLGHEGNFLPKAALERIELAINKHILAKGAKTIRVLHSGLGQNTPLIGAAAIAADKLFTCEIPLL